MRAAFTLSRNLADRPGVYRTRAESLLARKYTSAPWQKNEVSVARDAPEGPSFARVNALPCRADNRELPYGKNPTQWKPLVNWIGSAELERKRIGQSVSNEMLGRLG
jgi:hypothetical protein